MHRRKSSLTNNFTNKRLRGYHIKNGLDELGDLDVIATKKSTLSTKKDTVAIDVNYKKKQKHNDQSINGVSKQSSSSINNNTSHKGKRQRW